MSHIVKILSERKRCKQIEYERSFSIIGGENNGCIVGFPCDKNGTLIHNESYDCWIEYYNDCVAQSNKYKYIGVRENSYCYREPTHALCSCGAEILLQGDTYCDCGQLYNQFGQQLIDPNEWEENMEED